RLKSANLESISKWIKEGSPADEIAITLASSKSKTKFIAEIDAVGGYRVWKGINRQLKIKPKYPKNNFLDYVNKNFTKTQKKSFEIARNFYKKYNSDFKINELRGIDFDSPVSVVTVKKNSVMFQMVLLDDFGKPKFGSYFFENVNEDITKIGIGDFKRISSDNRVKVKVILESDLDFLKSKTTNIEDWTGSGSVFQGGGNQYYNPSARNKIKSFEILE
ncbi:MAG: hypothetical protein N4A49_06190, partial [Marinifilaceae bacterium]|nr:hypothetical protein [Marinifilaceae bacterium]